MYNYLKSTGAIQQAVQKDGEDEQDCLHCQLWRPLGALHGLQVCSLCVCVCACTYAFVCICVYVCICLYINLLVVHKWSFQTCSCSFVSLAEILYHCFICVSLFFKKSSKSTLVMKDLYTTTGETENLSN